MSLTHGERTLVNPPRIFWLLLGLGIILAADGSTALVLYTTAQWVNSSFFSLYLAAPIAALLVGMPAWFHFVVTPGCVTVKRGLLVGIVSSITAHPVMWMLLCLSTLFMPQAATSFSFLTFTIILSLIYGGWATTAIGALAGVLLIVLQRALMRANHQRVAREIEANQPHEMSNADAIRTRSEVEDVH